MRAASGETDAVGAAGGRVERPTDAVRNAARMAKAELPHVARIARFPGAVFRDGVAPITVR